MSPKAARAIIALCVALVLLVFFGLAVEVAEAGRGWSRGQWLMSS